ncbi:hypothetical protein K1T71_000129 [Dendrolimus kikuchii]|uniref:Uncharacterized protein n=1 Tax=Dendrolimus kikuchii TaxID=765133 RepID=A0ACC1DK02_9NEOP|nr:hypothetical protein K1T71_000129 [Dendrolimus kikuchii]
MKCARLQLLQRSKLSNKSENVSKVEKPRRYCQKRLVNPEHEEDPRWMAIFERFHCNKDNDRFNETVDSVQVHHSTEELFLTVQTLKFQGDIEQRKRPRTSFKYKTLPNNGKHRMFIKQVINDREHNDEEKSSQLTCYYFDDYIKYLFHNDKSRPASGTSSIFLQGLNNKLTENKDAEVNIPNYVENIKKSKKIEAKIKQISKKTIKNRDDKIEESESDIEDTQITYKKSGKRKSLTISRTQSPETVQIIRVDVVCNYRSISPISDYTDDIKENEPSPKEPEPKKDSFNIKDNHYAAKYQLTKTIKTLDENLYGGAKVTLLCKTFKLSERGKIFVKCKNPERRFSKNALPKNIMMKK